MLGRPLRTVVTITTGPGSSKRGGLTQLGGNKPSYFLDPRRKGPRSAAKWSAPWKRSFCSSGSDRNGTVSCRGHRHLACPGLRPWDGGGECAQTPTHKDTGNVGNGSPQTLSVFLFFWGGVRRPVAFVAGGWLPFLFLCAGEALRHCLRPRDTSKHLSLLS